MLGFDRQGVYIVSPSHMLKTSFVGAHPMDPQVEAADPVASTGAVAPLGKVTYTNLWDGVNLVYEAREGLVLKSTYYIDSNRTEAALKNIRLSYNRPVNLDEQGNLMVAFGTGNLVEKAPVAWQEVERAKRPVAAAYNLETSTAISFSLGDYLPGIPVIIDPDITWNTFLGGTNYDYGYGITVDSSGNVYITGDNGYDAFAAKLNNSGVLQWNTFLGGTGPDFGYGIAVDSSGNIYVTGYSSATWKIFSDPVRAYTSSSDAFVARLRFDPTVTGISPNFGTTAGGGVVTITGTRFYSPATVTIGGVASSLFVVDNVTQIRAVTPAGTAGAQDVMVTNPDGQSGTLPGGYIFDKPVVPTPELPTGVLLGTGIVSIGAYVLLKKKKVVNRLR